MIKKILFAGIGIIVSGLVRSQSANNEMVPSEILSGYIKPAIDPEANNVDSSERVTTAIFAINGTLYSGTIKRHKLQGKWESWYSNNSLCDSGSFVKGIPDGEWKHWDVNGRLLSIRTYNADKLMRIKNEMNRGHPRSAVYPLTSLYMKNRTRGRQYIEAGYSFSFTGRLPEKFSLQQIVENNVTPGRGYRPVFAECLHHGLYMNFFSDGRVSDSGYYKNGLRDGLWLHRNANDNSVLAGLYKNGARQGDWKQYNAAGNFTGIIYYNKRGEEQWRKRIRD